MSGKSILAAAIAAALFCPLVSQGTILTFVMEGTVSDVTDPGGVLGFARLGDRVTYEFSFDSGAPDTNGSPYLAWYSGIDDSLRAGSTDLTLLGSSRLEIQQADLFHVSSRAVVGDLTASVDFTLNDLDNIAIPDTSLPLVPYDLAPFELRGFVFGVYSPATPPDTYPPVLSTFSGGIDSFYAVPEPAMLLIMVFGATQIRRARHPGWPVGSA
jgi:hypothetical protein